MVLSGIFLSLQEQGIARFVVYDANYKILLQHKMEELLAYTAKLPENFQPLFQQAEKDFENHYYFCGPGFSEPAFPISYNVITVITDDDDNTIGYVELGLDPGLLVNQIAKLTTNAVMLYSPAQHAITLSSNAEMAEKLLLTLPEDLTGKSFVQTTSKSTALLTDILPLIGYDEVHSQILSAFNLTLLLNYGTISLGASIVQAENNMKSVGLLLEIQQAINGIYRFNLKKQTIILFSMERNHENLFNRICISNMLQPCNHSNS